MTHRLTGEQETEGGYGLLNTDIVLKGTNLYMGFLEIS